ncbi:MAG: DUF2029 domain-containing protein [Acidobacteriota bacterium]|nr:DUF2029 domain-containing protein [Acidobacteriota bacterium]
MRKISWSSGIVVTGLCVFWIMLGSRTLAGARAHDFLNLYTGASLALTGHFAELHDPVVQLARERQIVPQLTALVPFVRPGFYAAILAPLALLPYTAAFAVWIALQCALLLASWGWAWRKFGSDALVFAALFLPAPLGIATGQDCVLLLVIFIAAFTLAERGRSFASGLVLGLLLWKFHLVLLWPVALLVQRRWRALAGFALAGTAEFATCVALGGWGAIRTYIALLTNKNIERLSPSPELMISYQGFAANLGIASPAFNLLWIASIIAVFVWTVREAPLWRMFAVTAVASELIVPHVYGYDATLLLLPIWLTIFHSQRPASKIAATLLATPLPFLFALADKPWAVVSSASLLLFFAVLSYEKAAAAAKEPHSTLAAVADRTQTV